MSARFTKYFKKALVMEQPASAVAPAATEDAEIFKQSMEPAAAQAIEGEVSSVAVDPKQQAIIVQTAKKYYDEIKTWINVVHQLRSDIHTGALKSVSKDLGNVDLTKLAQDLAKISEGLLGHTMDSVTAPPENQ